MIKASRLSMLVTAALFSCVKVETVDPTQVLVRVTSELGSEATSHEVRVSDENEQVTGQMATIVKAPPFSFAIVPAAKFPARKNLVSVSALDAAGNVLAVSKTLVMFVDQRTLQVDVRLTQACRGRICGVGSSCVASVAGAGECLPVQQALGKEIKPVTMAGSEFTDMTMEGATPADDGGSIGQPSASEGGASDGGMGGAGGTTGGTTPGLDAGPGATAQPEAGATMGGAAEAGSVEAGTITMPECDDARPCSAGYVCTAGRCASRCEQTTCDPNATCALNNGAPVCTCNGGYIAKTETSGAVTCLRDVQCAELNCDANASCAVGTDQLRHCTCKTGYTGNGMTCTPVSCGALTIAHGSVQTNGATYNQTATYACDTGYTLTGGTARKCDVTGWTGTAPTCEPYDCRTPAAPSHGRVTVTNGTKYPSGSVRYTCDTGYSISGANSDTRTCNATGWSGTAPTCIGCGDGIVSQSLFEECELGLFSDPWSCINCKRSDGAYAPCSASGICPAGLGCHSAGYCTVVQCSSDAVCPPTPPGPVRSSCQGGGFACTLSGCTSTSQCPSGLRCDTASGFCIL